MVYSFRPGRNSQNPGDPPPRWGLKSRASRFAVGLAVVAGIVIGLLLAAAR